MLLHSFEEDARQAAVTHSGSMEPVSSSTSRGGAQSASIGVAASSGGKPRAGRGSRGPRPRLFKKNTCQSDGCTADLSTLPRYHQRNHICMPHKLADSFLRLGVEVRFCQRCGVAHPLPDFDGLKKSCRRQLAVHNSRRRKGSAVSPQGSAGAAPVVQSTEAAEAAEAAVAAAVAAEPAPQPLLPAPVAGAAEDAAVLGMDAELATRTDWALHAGASWLSSLDATPEVSAGSAALSGSDPGGWLQLGDTSSGGGGGSDSLWSDGSGDDLPTTLDLLPAELAEAAGAPAHELVCCACQQRVCGSCCAARDGATGAACNVAAGPGAAAAAGAERSRDCSMGGAPVSPDLPACGPAAREGQPADAASPASLGMSGARSHATEAAAAAAAEAEAEAQAEGAAAAAVAWQRPGGGASPTAAAALGALHHNAALYQLFVRQQLLAAQTLLTTAGAVLSWRLPLEEPLEAPATPHRSAAWA